MLCDPGYTGLGVPTYEMSEVPWATGFQGWWILRIPWGTCGGLVLRWPGVGTSN